jgi:protein-L-isoaspartate(D-aspartate) O-methyltransferase
LASAILDRFEAAGRPPMRDWRIALALTGETATPLWVPAVWELGAAG